MPSPVVSPSLSPKATVAESTVPSTTPQITPSQVASTPHNKSTSEAGGVQFEALKLLAGLPPDVSLSGNLVVGAQPSYLLDLAHGTQITLGNGVACLGTSPDRRWVSYCRSTDNSTTHVLLTVESADGQQVKKSLIPNNWFWLGQVSWLGNQHLAFNVDKPKGDRTTNYSVGVIDPFSGGQQVIASEYPELITWTISGVSPTTPFPYSSVVYDPSLNLVVYPQQTKDGLWYIVLWNRIAKQGLAQVEDVAGFGHLPIWSPGADQFVAVADPNGSPRDHQYHDEWYSVTRRGQVTRLTHFGDNFNMALIDTANWSPDGTELAFWVELNPSPCKPGQNLARLVLATLEVTDYCVYGLDYPPVRPPVWSPDDRYLIVESNQSQMLLVDTQQNWVAPTGISGLVEGWLAAP